VAAEEQQLDLCGKIIMACHPIGCRLCRHLLEGTDVGQFLSIPVSLTKEDPHGFDLQEEINSKSFFSATGQHRSLCEGSSLTSRLRQLAKSWEYSAQANGVLCFMRSFWDIDTHHYELTIIRLQRQMLAAQRIPAKLPAA